MLASLSMSTFWGSNYGLIGNGSATNIDSEPNPDFWSSVLFKKLVSEIVYDVEGVTGQSKTWAIFSSFVLFVTIDDGREVRLYSFKLGRSCSGETVFMILNTKNEQIDVEIFLDGKKQNMFIGWILTSYPNVINSRDIFINGELLRMNDNGTLPDIISKGKDIASGCGLALGPERIFTILKQL